MCDPGATFAVRGFAFVAKLKVFLGGNADGNRPQEQGKDGFSSSQFGNKDEKSVHSGQIPVNKHKNHD